MCIQNSVGRNAVNLPADVKTIQILLNLNHRNGGAPLDEDGCIGDRTIAAIGGPPFQVEPGSPLIGELRQGIPAGFSTAALAGIMIAAPRTTINTYAGPLRDVMREHQIDTPLRMAHFLAQVGHESGDLRFTEELASGEAYEKRADLGNTQPGDGPRFKGRGLIQLTGRANYVAYGKARGQDFVTPDNYRRPAGEPALAADVAGWFWSSHNLNKLADADDVRAVTKAVNGGLNGLADRTVRLVRAKYFLGV